MMKFLLLCLCLAMANAKLAKLVTSKHRTLPNSYIISVKDFDQLDKVESAIKGMFNKMRVSSPKIAKIDKLEPALTVKIPPRLLQSVRLIEGIDTISEDVMGTIFGTQYNPKAWGLDRIDSYRGLDDIYNYDDNAQGQGVNIYIVDTGINVDHDVFEGRASRLFGLADDNGHGSHCAGTSGGDVVGIARKANLYAVKVCDRYGACPKSEVLRGLNAVLTHGGKGDGAGVVSMSLGWPSDVNVDRWVTQLMGFGYTLSVAAGNENSNACYVSPARVSDVITVGATDNTDRRASFSNYGKCVDLFAPGVDIYSASNVYDDYIVPKSGTSMACPHVTGAAAVYLGKHPGSSAVEVQNGLVNEASSGVVSDTRGSPNKLLYIKP